MSEGGYDLRHRSRFRTACLSLALDISSDALFLLGMSAPACHSKRVA